MPGLSIGAYIAWQYAAGEAAEAGHPYVEARHVFLGVLSLEKALVDREGPELRWNEREQLRVEADVVAQVLNRLGMDATSLRRAFREKIGRGSHFHGGDIVHRSQKCRALFAQSQSLAGQEKNLTALHLLVTISADTADRMGHLLTEVGIVPTELGEIARNHFQYVEAKPSKPEPAQAKGRGKRGKARSAR
jgi:ATP-dependent Clp protease ATP-binding subunit ClpA